MKIAIITDLHLDYRKAEPKFYNFFMKFYKELFFPYIKENKISTVFDLGDTFDHRRNLDIYGVAKIKNDFFDYLEKENIDFHMLVGNHDIYYRQSNVVNTPKALLGHYKNITIYEEIKDIVIDNLKITMCPWINKENEELVLSHIENTDSEILMGHLELNNFELNKNVLMTHSDYDAELFKKYKKVLTGHYHHKSNKGNIYYLGNPYEITWADYNDSRGFHVLDTKTLELEFIKNPFKLYEKIYYNSQTTNYDSFNYSYYQDKVVKIIVEEKNNDKEEFENFLKKLEAASPHEVSIVDKLEEIDVKQHTGEDDILTNLFNYVKVVHEDVNTNKLKDTLSNIYQETLV